MITLGDYSLPKEIFSDNLNTMQYGEKNVFLLSQGKDGWLSALCFNICLYIRGIHSIPQNSDIQTITGTLEDIINRIKNQTYIVFTNEHHSPQLDAGDQSAGDEYFNKIKKRTKCQGIQLQELQLPAGDKQLKYQAIQKHLAQIFEEYPDHDTYTKTLITGELFGTSKYPDTLDTILARQLHCERYASYRKYFKDIKNPKDKYGEWSSTTGPFKSVVFQDSQEVFLYGDDYDYNFALRKEHYDPLGEDGSIQTAIVQGPTIVPQITDQIALDIKEYIQNIKYISRKGLLCRIIESSFPIQTI